MTNNYKLPFFVFKLWQKNCFLAYLGEAASMQKTKLEIFYKKSLKNLKCPRTRLKLNLVWDRRQRGWNMFTSVHKCFNNSIQLGLNISTYFCCSQQILSGLHKKDQVLWDILYKVCWKKRVPLLSKVTKFHLFIGISSLAGGK